MPEQKITVLTAYPIELAQGDDTCKYATFLISVLDEYDRMGRMIPKEAGEKYHETLRGFPLVAKLIKDRANRGIDFGAHEMRKYRKRNGQEEVTFDTYPIGSVVDTWIEQREVAGYDGLKDCIMARAKLWTCRSPEYFKVLDRLWEEGQVSSSWELIVSEKEEQSLGRKILRAFSFIGNAILGTTSVPAVRGAGILEYAEAEEEYVQTTEDLNEALLKDLQEKHNLTDLFISHDLSVVEHISDTVGVMYLGNLVEYGPTERIFENPLHPYTKALLSAVPVPDPDAKMNRIVLEGSIPSPANPPKGCKFHTRCANCMECCKTTPPRMIEIEPDHFVVCHLYDSEAGK